MSIKGVMDAFGDVSHRFFARICFQYFSLDYFFIILGKKTVQVVQGIPEKLCFFSLHKDYYYIVRKWSDPNSRPYKSELSCRLV